MILAEINWLLTWKERSKGMIDSILMQTKGLQCAVHTFFMLLTKEEWEILHYMTVPICQCSKKVQSC